LVNIQSLHDGQTIVFRLTWNDAMPALPSACIGASQVHA